MRILMLGTGGVGGYFGGRLVEGGANVTFLVRPKRRAQLQQTGLQVKSALGDLRLPVATVLAEELRPEFDIVMLSCKAYDLESALDAIAPAMKGRAAVVPLLNGVAHFDRLDARFGAPNVLGGTCMINALLDRDGVVHHTDPLQRLIFGERDRSTSERTQALAAVFKPTKIDWELSDDVQRNVWEKLTFLAVLAAGTCLFRGNVGEIVSAPGGAQMLSDALSANVTIATLEGHPPRDSVVEFARRRLTEPNATWSSSMLRDVETGSRTEADHIVGWMIDRARTHGVAVPLLSTAYTHLKAYETRREAGRLPVGG